MTFSQSDRGEAGFETRNEVKSSMREARPAKGWAADAWLCKKISGVNSKRGILCQTKDEDSSLAIFIIKTWIVRDNPTLHYRDEYVDKKMMYKSDY